MYEIEQYNKAFYNLVEKFTLKIFDDYIDEYTEATDIARVIGYPNLSHLAPVTVDFNEGEYYFSINEIYETLKNDFSKESVLSWYDYNYELCLQDKEPNKNFFNYCKYFNNPEQEEKDRKQSLKESNKKVKEAKKLLMKELKKSKTVRVD